MSGPGTREQNKEATCYVGNLDERVTQKVLTEMMKEAGMLVHIYLPIDKVNGQHQGFGFVEYMDEQTADYAAAIMNGVRVFGKPVRVNKASADKQKTVEIGAELFIGNLDAMVDEKALYDTFSRFGALLSVPKIARDDVGISKGYGFISFGDFESADAAIANMNGQYMMNKEISVQYAYKKDGKGERHGDEAERMLAKQAKAHGVAPAAQPLPAHLFQAAAPHASAPPDMVNGDARGIPGAPHGPSSYSGPPGGRPSAPASLPPPPSGLPARPPTGTLYTPPVGFNGTPPPGFGAPGLAAPPGFGQPAQGYLRR